MPDPTIQCKLASTAICPACAEEQARAYRLSEPEDRPLITSAEQATDPLVPLLQDLDREHALALNPDEKHRLVATTTVSISSIDHPFNTRRFGQAREVLDIDVVDHIVIGHQRSVCLVRRGAVLQHGAVTDFRDHRSEAASVGRTMRR